MMCAEAVVVIPAFNEQDYIPFPLIRLHMESLYFRQGEPIPVVVVDNGSTDQTKQVAQDIGEKLAGIELHLVDEKEKGTGRAADTGFRYAIENMGAKILARTDANSRPVPSWYTALLNRHKSDPKIQLLTGPSFPHIETIRYDADDYTIPVSEVDILDLAMMSRVINAKRVTRLMRSIRYADPAFNYAFAPGYNMSTTALAYKETGGFPRTAIDHTDEDVTYNRMVGKIFGFRSKKFDIEMQVQYSLRRERTLSELHPTLHTLGMGYVISALHYALPGHRQKNYSDIR